MAIRAQRAVCGNEPLQPPRAGLREPQHQRGASTLRRTVIQQGESRGRDTWIHPLDRLDRNQSILGLLVQEFQSGFHATDVVHYLGRAIHVTDRYDCLPGPTKLRGMQLI